MLTLERLRRVLSYDRDTGLFVRRIAAPNAEVGTIAGYIDVNGYRCLDVDGRPYKAHRLVWFYVTGTMPVEYIDHVNGQKSDNRFANLRLATNSQNQANRGLAQTNTSGTTGVRFEEGRQKWRASITIRGTAINLGRFATKEEATAAYQTARNNAWGEYVRGAKAIGTVTADEFEASIGAINHSELTVEFLKSILAYDPQSGRFTRPVSRQGQSKAGDVAGSIEWTGYRNIKIRGKRFRAHHLAWLYVYGRLPRGEVDHINGVRDDNRIDNLRETTRRQNSHNTRGHKDSLLGIKGVAFDARCIRKYYARIKIGGKHINLGHFLTAEDAAAAYNDAARAAFGEFAKPPPE